RGGSLSRVLAERKTLQPGEIRKLLADVGSALGYAHKRGIVHRDIKPDNIMFDEFGQCVVTDFGIAKAGSGSKLTGTGMSIGTPHYMSPEQARAQSIDGRSDLYSLGVLAYQALVGEVPYDGEDSFAIGYKHIMEPIPVPLLDTSDERRLFEIVKKLIMKDPLDRFQDAEALLRALEGQPRESTLGRRPSAAQAIMSIQSTTPLPAASIALSPPASGRPSQFVPAGAPSGGPSVGSGNPDTPRRPVLRRSIATQEPPKGNLGPWLLALLVIIFLLLGASALYRKGVLGGRPAQDSITPGVSQESVPQVRQDSLATRDSTLLTPELARFDSLPADSAGHLTPVPKPPAQLVRPPEANVGDSGMLMLENLPRGSQVYIDSRPVTQPGAGIRLPVGWHELGVSARGYAFFTDSIRIEPAGRLVVSPNLSATDAPAPAAGSQAEMRRRVLARLDCDNPSIANRFGRACYDSPPLALGPTRVALPSGTQGVPSVVIVVVKVSRQGKTLAVRTRQASNAPAFTQAVENYVQNMTWTPAMRDGQPVDGWTQAAFMPDTP
ncbi:MAG: protein kinase, partial [bacterium]